MLIQKLIEKMDRNSTRLSLQDSDYLNVLRSGVEDFVDTERFGIVVLILGDLFNHGRFIWEKTRQTLSL